MHQIAVMLIMNMSCMLTGRAGTFHVYNTVGCLGIKCSSSFFFFNNIRYFPKSSWIWNCWQDEWYVYVHVRHSVFLKKCLAGFIATCFSTEHQTICHSAKARTAFLWQHITVTFQTNENIVNVEYIMEADENADTADSFVDWFLKESATFQIQNILWSWNTSLTN